MNVRERLASWILGRPLPVAIEAVVTLPINTLPNRAMSIGDMGLADNEMGRRSLKSSFVLPSPPPFVSKKAAMALDDSADLGALYNWATLGAYNEGLGFLGYAALAELSQRPEYRRVSEIWAAEATRKFIKLTGDDAKCAELQKAFDAFDVRAKIREVVEHDGFFGRGQLFIDLGNRPNDPELSAPLMIRKEKIGKGKLKGFKAIEPFWSYPGIYDSTNPLDPSYYRPQYWQVMSSQVDASRLLTFVGREMPDMLKPAYSFGGLALSQMVKPYVDNFLRTRQSVSDLLHSFSTMVLSTNMGQVLMGAGATNLMKRAQLFNQTRDNRGLMLVDKDTEELANVTTPLSGLAELQSQSQEQIASVSGIPLVILLGVTPSGLNASSDGEIKTFYNTIKGYQERVLRGPVTTIMQILMLHTWGAIDEEIGFEFEDLYEMDEEAKARIRKSDADADVAYTSGGIVTADEVRDRITEDEDSPWYGRDLSADAPEAPDDEAMLSGLNDPGDDPDAPPEAPDKPTTAADADWREDDHKRSGNGQFGSGGGAAGTPSPAAPSTQPKAVNPGVQKVLGDEGIAKLRAQIEDKSSTARDILDTLKPLDHASAAMTPTLAHNATPDRAFFDSRTYVHGMGIDATITHLENVAADYAGPGGVQANKQARILLGPPAAGKSTSAEEIARQGGYAIVDGDDAKKVIPEFDDGVGASAVHEESGAMSQIVLRNMLAKGDNVILPVVGASSRSIEDRIALLKEAGYAVTVDLVDVSPDNAARRMAGRVMRTGRHISSAYFASIGNAPQETYENLKTLYPDLGFGRIDGNGPARSERYAEAHRHPDATAGKSLFGSG